MSLINVIKYPDWCDDIGWAIASLSLICVPIGAIHELYVSQGVSIRPEDYSEDKISNLSFTIGEKYKGLTFNMLFHELLPYAFHEFYLIIYMKCLRLLKANFRPR